MARNYGDDKKEWLQIRVPSWLKAKLLDKLPSGEISNFVREAILEKLARENNEIYTVEAAQ